MDGQGQLPTGGNILFKDGHVEWRPFSAMNPNEKFGTPQFQY
jgi:prepilin-type processing-associated H-X9-DG protein